jgi:hypothetical protein
MPQAWWLRPVRSAARVGEQSAVVWKLANRTPVAASPSITGVSMSEPKHPSWAKPTSSSTTSSTFGDPVGIRAGAGHHGSDSQW